MSVERFATVNVDELVAWITAIPFEEWPQQHRLPDGKIRPAMVNDLDWHGLRYITRPLIMALISLRPLRGGIPVNRMLSVVMPGHHIDAHVDKQEPDWLTRVHVPLVTNEDATFITGGVVHRLEVGSAYLVDVQAEHAVTNDGDCPRIHFMFDVRKSS